LADRDRPAGAPACLERLLAGLDPEQHEAATALPGPLLVIAGAGAGKTRTLIARAAYALERVGIATQAIPAVEFTIERAGAVHLEAPSRFDCHLGCASVGQASRREGEV
jgi:hypothetical protein